MALNATEEQLIARDLFRTGQSLRLNAAAGSGKTTTLDLIARDAMTRLGSRHKIIYTTFSKRLAEEAKERFPRNVRVVTNHGMAFRYTGVRYAGSGRLSGRILVADVIAHFGWTEQIFAPYADLRTGTYGVIATLERFLQSADPLPAREHATPSAYSRGRSPSAVQVYADKLATLACELWEQLIHPACGLPVTHDVYLKEWALGSPQLPCSALLVDEGQDSSDVMIGVFRGQVAPVTVVGDGYQQIYGWRGAVNAMGAFKTAHSASLTRSFRFGQSIADVANAVLANFLDAPLQIIGNPAMSSRIEPVAQPRCVIARTNSAIIGELVFDQLEHPSMRLGVVGGVEDMLKLIDGAEALMRGDRTGVRELSEFLSWPEVVTAADEAGYQYLKVLVDLVETYGISRLRALLLSVRGNERDEGLCHRLYSTTHKSKGRQFESVKLCDDFIERPPTQALELESGWTPEEGNLLYVAATRAQQQLDISHCSAIQVAITMAPLPASAAEAGGADDDEEWFTS
ncbi:MAG: UvrD-helicase domain-containing protein [Rhodanobacter sp.]